MKSVKVGMLVSVPDRICFPYRRDPYEYENGIVLEVAKGKAKVRVYRSFTKQTYEKWFSIEWIKKVSFHHRVGEEEEFNKWLSIQNIVNRGEDECRNY